MNLKPSQVVNIQACSVWGFKRDTRGTRNSWFLDCACGRSTAFDMSVDSKLATLTKLAQRKGWTVGRKQPPICSHCLEEKKQMSRAQIGPDPKIARKVFAALEDHFDEPKRLFKPGWSDQKIADELKVALPVIVSIREDAFGKLAENPEVTQLRDDIELLKLEFGDKFAALSSDFGARVAELEARLPKGKKGIC